MPIYEPGLESLVSSNTAEGRLHFTTHVAEAVEYADIYFIAVGTPSNTKGMADLCYVYEVAGAIGQHMSRDKVVISKSTMPVGTTDEVKQRITAVLQARGRADLLIDVVANPEFLK